MGRRGRWWAAFILAGVVVWFCGGLRAAVLRIAVGDSPANTPSGSFRATLQPSEEATTLLSRADEAIKRKDWKLAIDSLQRIVELPGEHILTSDGRVYESARLQAHRRIASLPARGLQAYRLVYDGEAAALAARALEQHDPALLRTIVEKHLLTSVGDDAALALADWLIDEGRFAEAAGLLQRVKSVYPDSDLPAWVIPSRRAVCAAGMGQRQRAEAILRKLATTRPAGSTPATQPDASEEQASSGCLPPADRLRQINAYIARTAAARASLQAASWPMTLGSPLRNGRMPAVEPTFIDHRPWTVPLPVTEPRQGFGAVEQYARRGKLIPVRQMVTDGRTLVVKGQRELLGLDVDSFTPVWRTGTRLDPADVPPQPQQEVVALGHLVLEEAGERDPLDDDPVVRRLLYDSVGAGVVIALDMVLTVEWSQGPPRPLAMAGRAGGVFGGGVVIGGVLQGGARSPSSGPNRVIAYSLRDGSLVWMSDTTRMTGSGSEDARLGAVEFVSVPIPVNGYLLAPCRVNSDLYAVALDPRTGVLARQFYLCGTGGGPFDSLHALEPAAADGVVFIPTGRGMLFALEASTWSVRWAVRYELPEGGLPAAGWLPTPVIAVADVVLCAPGDADYLFCLDRATGEVRWRVPREGFAYLLGATDAHVWMAGPQVQLIEVETGRPVWRQGCGEPAGRGVISGDRIYLPTVEGVVAMNALTGEDIADAQPVAGEPPGNLLAWDGSLYSVGISSVKKFPDLNRGYADAVSRHLADPTSAPRAIRLAWLELLRHRPAKALAAMADLPETLKAKDERRYEQVIHLRVLAMLELAASGEVPSSRALELLREARTIAASPEDAIHTALALGDHYHREHLPLEACRQYLSVVLSRQGDLMISSEGGFEERARGLAMRKIEDAAKGLAEVQARTFENHVRQWLDEVTGRHDAERLLWLAECPALGDAANEANLLLGRWAADGLRYEQAEHFFVEALRGTASPKLAAEAAARLAAIHLEPAELHLPVSASRVLDRLEHEFAAVKLPADVLNTETEPEAAGEREHGRRLIAGARVAAALRKRIDADTLGRHEAAMARISLGEPGEATAADARGSRPISIRGRRQEPLADVIMTLVDGNRVEARSAARGRNLWRAELRLLGEPAVEITALATPVRERALSGRASPARAAEAVLDGQALIINSAYGLHAVGLLTGRRLWARRFDPPCLPDQEPSGSDAWVWAHEGYLISVNARGQLEVSRTCDGERILWRRSLSQREWYAVRTRGDYVVAVDRGLERVDVFRLADGRYLGECRFIQDETPGRKVNIALYDDVICGPVSGREVAALELATPGAERWRVAMPDNLSQLFKPTPELVAVADRSGRVEVIDPGTGKSRIAATVYACEEGVTDGALVDGVLYVCGYQVRARPATGYDRQRWAMAAIRMQDNRILWQRRDIGARAYLPGDVLRVSSNAIPVAVFTPSTRRQAEATARSSRGSTTRADGKMVAGMVELSIVDKATGETVGETVAAPVPKGAGAYRILDVAVWPGQVIVTVGSSVLRFPINEVGDD